MLQFFPMWLPLVSCQAGEKCQQLRTAEWKKKHFGPGIQPWPCQLLACPKQPALSRGFFDLHFLLFFLSMIVYGCFILTLAWHQKNTGFPGSSVVKNSPAKKEIQVWPLIRKIPRRRKWQPTLVFSPGKSHGQRGPVGCGPWGGKRVRHDLTTTQQEK